jgi:hypothetical protein
MNRFMAIPAGCLAAALCAPAGAADTRAPAAVPLKGEIKLSPRSVRATAHHAWGGKGLFRAALAAICAIALAWLPRAALAVDVRALSITISDAVSGHAGKLFVGRKLNISCHYRYYKLFQGKPVDWKVRLEVDGKPIASLDGSPPIGGLYKPFFATATWTAPVAGSHVARCVLDPDAELAEIEIQQDRKNNVREQKFAVDVVPAYGPGESKAQAAGVPPVITGTSAQGPQPKVLDPELAVALAAHVLPNCGKGQDVVRVGGTIKNVGWGHAVIPPGKPIVKIESPAGVYGANITIGSLAPGQAQQVTVMLKSKAMPESLAGAKLNLSVSVIQGVIKQSNDKGSYQELRVVFPANYCKQGRTTSGAETDKQRAAPKRQ